MNTLMEHTLDNYLKATTSYGAWEDEPRAEVDQDELAEYQYED